MKRWVSLELYFALGKIALVFTAQLCRDSEIATK